MIGLVGAKIWVENGVDFGDPVNLVGLAARPHRRHRRRHAEVHRQLRAERHRPRHDHGHRLLPPREPWPPRRAHAPRRGRGDPGAVKPAPFATAGRGRSQEALAALAGEPNAKVLAGGQSLVPLLSMRLAAPSLLVDINGLPGLADVTVDDGEGVRGSGRSPGTPTSSRRADVRRVQPLLAMALAHVAHATIRNRGTTVGSIVHADAAAEMPVVLDAARRLRRASPPSRAPARSRPTSCSSARWSRPLAHDEIAVVGVLPGAGAGRRGRLRRDRPAARRLRAVRRRRAGPPRRRLGRRGPRRLPLRQRHARPSST